ncbi:MAG: biotin/lipoyl-containing protein [Elusimicrobiota bacterium]
MDVKRIENFFDVINKTDISELSWEKHGIRVRVKRNAVSCMPHPITKQAVVTAEKSETAKLRLDNNNSEYCVIKSKMVGTFYSNDAKNDKPFVKEGDVIKKGTKLGVVEAMKIMKEVVSEIDGVIDKVLIKNGKPVEYGEEIFLVKLSA